MAVSFDAASESHTGTTGSQSEASFTWNHGGASSGVAGVVVFTFNATGVADDATAVTYGGVSLAAVTGGLAVDSLGEQGNCKAWFLGASVPQGTQAIVVTRANNAAVHYAVAATVLASASTEYTGVLLEQGDQVLAQENIDDDSPGTNSLRFAGTHSGAANITAALLPGANSTLLAAIDFGANVAMAVRETTAGQGARPVGFVAGSDDVAAVYLAVREISGGTAHTATITDPLGLVDSAAQVTTSVRDLTDPLGLTDSATYPQDFVRSVTDTLGMVDVGTWFALAPDNLGLTDSVTVALTVAVTVTDNLGLVDSITVLLSTAVTITDPLGLLDSVSDVVGYVRPLTDPLGLSDSITVETTGTTVVTITDGVGLTDTVTTAQSIEVSITDTLGLVDTAAAELGIVIDLTDPLGLTDTATSTAVYIQTFTDLLGLTDTISASVSGSTFWSLDPAGYTLNPVAYAPVGPDDTPPPW